MFGSWSEFRKPYRLSLPTDERRLPENTSQQSFVECQEESFREIFVERKMIQNFRLKAAVSNAGINKMFLHLHSPDSALESDGSPCQKAGPIRVSWQHSLEKCTI